MEGLGGCDEDVGFWVEGGFHCCEEGGEVLFAGGGHIDGWMDFEGEPWRRLVGVDGN